MEKLKLAIQDIHIANELIKASSGSFIKRILARIIALRMHNLIGDQIFFRTNNLENSANITLKNFIKEDLKALRDLYNDFFEQPRHKFTGHFQHLPLGERIDLWSKIDFTTASFFYQIPIDIYSRFSSAENYEPLTSLFLGFEPTELAEIKKVSEKHGSESQHIMASDVLSFTRPNTGGIVHGTTMQNQCGALNALELIIDFEFDLLDSLKSNPKAFDLLKKVLIIDIVNYTDNLFTRTDVLIGDPQYYQGLDELIPVEFPEPIEILNEFKAIYKLQPKLSALRNVRDKACSHLDSASSVASIQALLDTTSIDSLVEYYTTLKSVLEKAFRSNIVLTAFLVKNEPLGDDMYFTNLDPEPFSKEDEVDDFSEPVTRIDYQDENLLESALNAIEDNPQDIEARKFIANALSSTDIISKERLEIIIAPNSFRYNYFEYRKAHKYIIDILNNTETSVKQKHSIISMFSSFSPEHGIHKILFDTYSTNSASRDLKRVYVFAFGELVNENVQDVITLLQNAYYESDFIISYNCLLALFKIDISKRRGHVIGSHDLKENIESKFVKEKIRAIHDPFHRIATVAGLASEFANHRKLAYSRKLLNPVYEIAFEQVFTQSISELITLTAIPTISRNQEEEIKDAFNNANYTVAFGILANHFDLNGRNDVALLLYSLFLERIIAINWQHENSVLNYAVFLFKSGDRETAIKLLESLIEVNPHKLDFHGAYLSYLKEIDPEKFETEKRKLESNYNLSPEDQSFIDSI